MLPAVAARSGKAVQLVATVLLVLGVLAVLAHGMPAVLSLHRQRQRPGPGRVRRGRPGRRASAWRAECATTGSCSRCPRPTRHPVIALAVAKTNFPDEPLLGATVLLYLLVGLLIGIPYQVWQQRRIAT